MKRIFDLDWMEFWQKKIPLYRDFFIFIFQLFFRQRKQEFKSSFRFIPDRNFSFMK